MTRAFASSILKSTTMKIIPSTILNTLNRLEKEVQQLKVALCIDLDEKQTVMDAPAYRESEIIKELKKIRKKRWHELYQD